MSLAEVAPRRLRRDAEANAVRILDSAHAVFAEHGFDASMEQVAEHAGVGVGTLYRHFGSKAALVDAIAASVCDRMTTLAAEVRQAGPGEALFLFVRRSLDRSARSRALRSSPPCGRAPMSSILRRLTQVLDTLVADAHAAGTLRPGVCSADVVVAILGLRSVDDLIEEGCPVLRQRHLQIVIDGLRADGCLGGAPVSDRELSDLLAGRG